MESGLTSLSLCLPLLGTYTKPRLNNGRKGNFEAPKKQTIL